MQVTKDNGKTWENVKNNINGIPEKIWVSRVEASKHSKGRAYVSFDNHRFDDNRPYVFFTEDFGDTWTNISSNLPEDYSVYVIKEDYIDENLLFVGTEKSVYFSNNRGITWEKLGSNLPTVAIHDLVIHPRDGDLIAGTHGRSIWILDDINPLRFLNKKEDNLLPSRLSTKWIKINTGRKQPFFEFRGENPSYGSMINFFSTVSTKGELIISKSTEKNYSGPIFKMFLDIKEGINRFIWPFKLNRSQDEFIRYREKFVEIKKEFKDIVRDKKGLDSYNFKDQKSFTDLNVIRKKFLDNYGMYAGGEKVFPKKLYEDFEVSEGIYNLKIRLENGKEFTDKIVVREDPIKSN